MTHDCASVDGLLPDVIRAILEVADDIGLETATHKIEVPGGTATTRWLDWAQLQRGGTIAFALGSTAPENGWGTQAEALPASFCATPGAVLE